MLEAINGLYVKIVSCVAIRGSSYLASPGEIQSRNCLLNKRNREDNNCFLYFYVEAWHVAYAQSLYENVGWRMRMNPETYSPSNPLTHQPVGDFEAPMAFGQIPLFENLNKVQVNVFRCQNKDLIPLPMSTTVVTIRLRPSPERWSSLPVCFDWELENFKSAIRNKFHDIAALYAVTASLFATQLKFMEDILRLACRTKQLL